MAFFIEGSSSDSNITDEDRENLKKLDDVAEKMKNLDEGLEKINNTTTEINNLKTGKADVNHTHQYADIENTPNLDDYASKEYVNQEIAKVETVKGDKGDKGEPGEKGQDGAPGQKGQDGITPTLKIGTTTTLESGNNATVTMTNDDNVYTINFGIPKGEKGASGTGGGTGEVDLSNYATKTYVDTKIGEIQPVKGDKGETGEKGQDGLSAYDIAKAEGFDGDKTQWLASLKGEKGAKGDAGEKGETGTPGAPGEKGKDGVTPTLKIGSTTTLESGNNATIDMTNDNNIYTISFGIPKGEKGLNGTPGTPGEKGKDGMSAYEIAKKGGYTGSETDWIASLKGAKGDKGETGAPGEKGEKGADGEKGDKGQDGTFDIDATYTQLVTTDKTVLGAINEVFTSASNGKKLIAQAITGKGVETSETDTFSTMAQNISNIPSGSGGIVTQSDLDFLDSVKKDVTLLIYSQETLGLI